MLTKEEIAHQMERIPSVAFRTWLPKRDSFNRFLPVKPNLHWTGELRSVERRL